MRQIDELIQLYLKDLEYEPIFAMLENINSGKKLRSKLLLSITGEDEQSLKLCAIIELIHLASLLHDDIIDESTLRRGVKSVNAEFGAKNALMLGDILYSKAFFELCSFGKDFAQIVSNAVVKLAIGELMDVNLSHSFNTDRQKYLCMIYNKTAVLIEASVRCGALMAGLDENSFCEYGKNIGLAFQMIDDILDIKGDEKTLGKPVMNDFKEGKTTLPYIYLFETLQRQEQKKLLTLFKKNLNEEERCWLENAFIESKALQRASDEAKEFAKKALEALKNYSNPKLYELAHSMVIRDF
ncbi:polyprenyl synthetase family protein [Campylobacter sp. MIT 21-1685]|uniref:polyprenyl synthetase family protein n=1 Tax=unclassified Campylobacter TaxID=2593542 RepID=UPI00224B39E2|nr:MULTISPECIES: polyprenyl synthetase family protein [unclassified Campylobacter]MCX2682908.1 polyprenyl synthetase family protein [Campylobacter sp. MIT 21-1684]MCX2751144.1 polyprenyl synthetase family protein [Campylobacter sp. MIT 21-1682]MCX2807389.1 polyprenyl synthetase family protein [Campylobacter sp. MIT 21-1685]